MVAMATLVIPLEFAAVKCFPQGGMDRVLVATGAPLLRSFDPEAHRPFSLFIQEDSVEAWQWVSRIDQAASCHSERC
jgi:hypothetical protein